ncbi:hypothetical protein BC826DRAFT_1103931 [Russula brevipes]|nr:hypothetical protein BC826DRAFT_1103931 [Russula brevipes]
MSSTPAIHARQMARSLPSRIPSYLTLAAAATAAFAPAAGPTRTFSPPTSGTLAAALASQRASPTTTSPTTPSHHDALSARLGTRQGADVDYGLFDHVKNLLDDDDWDIETGRGASIGVSSFQSMNVAAFAVQIHGTKNAETLTLCIWGTIN